MFPNFNQVRDFVGLVFVFFYFYLFLSYFCFDVTFETYLVCTNTFWYPSVSFAAILNKFVFRLFSIVVIAFSDVMML